MSIRLKIASLWFPEFILKRELSNIAIKTTEALISILKQHIPINNYEKELFLKGTLDERRIIMTKTHNYLIQELIDVLGYEEAVRIGRDALFQVGYRLGREARGKLGVGNSFQDLEIAAKILYRILGIDFKIENKKGNIIMIVKRCELSKNYSPEACIVLSATDEGVVSGLNENINMQFKERITEGGYRCMACINEVKL